MTVAEDVAQSLVRSYDRAGAAVVGSLDNNPDEAARSLELEKATGVPAGAIHADVEGFEQHHKAQLASDIVRNNPHLSDYVHSHPLAATVSNDDWGTLDKISAGLTRLGTSGTILAPLAVLGMKPKGGKSALEAGAEGFAEGWNEVGNKYHQELMDYMASPEYSQLFGPTLIKAGATLEAVNQLFTAGTYALAGGVGQLYQNLGGNEAQGARLTRDMVALTQVAMSGQGGLGIHPHVIAEAERFAAKAGPYLKAGEVPPFGTHPILDEGYRKQAKLDADNLDEIIRDAQQSSTLARSKEMFQNFLRTHPEGEVGLTPDAIRRIYGDEEPSPQDGKLGWVPNIVQQVRAAASLGTDVKVPIKDFVANVDPEMWKEIREDVRIRDGGVTENEGKLDFGPLAQEEEPESKFKLERDQTDKAFTTYNIISPSGEVEGQAKFTLGKYDHTKPGSPPTEAILDGIYTKHWMPSPTDEAGIKSATEASRGAFGPSVMRDLLNQFREEFPEVKSIKANRVSGARFGGEVVERGRQVRLEIPVRNVMDTIDAIRDASAQEPLFAPKKLKLQRLEEEGQPEDLAHGTSGYVELEGRTAGGGWQGFRDDEPMQRFELQDEQGTPIGELHLTSEKGGKLLWVDWIGGMTGPQGFGLRLMKDLLNQLRAEFPQAESIGGYRVSGAREKAGAISKVIIPLAEELRPDHLEGLHDIIGGDAWAEFDPGVHVIVSDAYTAAEQAIVDRVNAELDRIAPKGVRRFHTREIDLEGRHITGLYTQYTTPDLPTLLWSLDSPDPVGTARHEAIHHLRRMGYITSEEWALLRDEAIRGEWLKKHDIMKRYRGRGLPTMIEEAIAEEFAAWRKAEKPDHPWGKTFQRILDLIDTFKSAVKDALGLGREMTWEDVFGKIESGEVGNRLGTKPLDPRAYAPPSEKLVRSAQEPPKGTPEGTSPIDKASAIGMTAAMKRLYDQNIRRRNTEDIEKQTEVQKREAKRKLTPEWKANEERVNGEVADELSHRPDLMADAAMRKGERHEERPKIDASMLSEEQKSRLPKEYYAKGGANPDDVAGMFGFDSGDTLVNRLSLLNEARQALDLTPGEYLKRLHKDETERRMQQEYGTLDDQILTEAKEHVVGQTQMDLLHDETMALAQKAGANVPLTKDGVVYAVRQGFNNAGVSAVGLNGFMDRAGRAGKSAEMALLKGDFAEAYRQKQVQFYATIAANEAAKFAKEMARFEATASRFSARSLESVDQEYTNWIHDILMRTGNRVKRSVQDLNEAIGHAESKSLEDFVNVKTGDLREVPVADFLLDRSWRKQLSEMTVDEFRAVHDSIKTLAKNGSDENKIYRAGEARDIAEVRGEMTDMLERLGRKEVPTDTSKGGPWRALKTFGYAHLSIETMLNRWSRGDPKGIFNRFIAYPLADAANSEAAMQKKFAKKLAEVGKIKDIDKVIQNPIFYDPLDFVANADGKMEVPPDATPMAMRKRHALAVLQNVGNPSNLKKLTEGHNVSADSVMQWLFKNTTKEDWDRAQAIGDVFAELKRESDRMYRRISGVSPENIELQPIDTPFGQYRGWYHPIVKDPNRRSRSPKTRGDALEGEGYYRATTPAGYTMARTGDIAPLELNLDMIPSRMHQIIHDVSFREAIIQASKVFYDNRFRDAVTKHYSEVAEKMLIPYLKDVANSSNFRSDAAHVGERWFEFFRQNTITTLIGLNPSTVLKHFNSALLNSMREVGPINFLHAIKSLFDVNDETSNRNFRFATHGGEMADGTEWGGSEELQRRFRNWQQTIEGAQHNIQTKFTPTTFQYLRQLMMHVGSTPVAVSDYISAVPTWLAAYQKEKGLGTSHGESVTLADRAVRRAHGSSVITNVPALARGNALARSYASLYGFFSDILQRQYDMMWQARDSFTEAKKGNYEDFKRHAPNIAMTLIISTVLLPLIEETVTPYTNSERESWGKKIAKTLALGASSSLIGVRDFIHAAINDRDPQPGLAGTWMKTFADISRDIQKGKLDKEHAGRLIKHGLTAIGAATGLTNAQEGRTGEFMYNWLRGSEHPKGFVQWFTGLWHGTNKPRGHR